ncbi:hypothetical protein AAY473_015346 [Plecturocebus cupreus]
MNDEMKPSAGCDGSCLKSQHFGRPSWADHLRLIRGSAQIEAWECSPQLVVKNTSETFKQRPRHSSHKGGGCKDLRVDDGKPLRFWLSTGEGCSDMEEMGCQLESDLLTAVSTAKSPQKSLTAEWRGEGADEHKIAPDSGTGQSFALLSRLECRCTTSVPCNIHLSGSSNSLSERINCETSIQWNIIQCQKEMSYWLGVVAHACNPSTLGG